MEYNRNQNSYEELQTIVEAQQERIKTLLTKLCRIKLLVLDEETFNEAMKDASEAREKTTEETFKLPTKWKVKDCKEVSEYAHKRFGCANTVFAGGYLLHVDENRNGYGFTEREGYQEITLEQFLQFVYRPFLDSLEAGLKTEFTLDQNEIYSLEGTTEEQRGELLTWLLDNDKGWSIANTLTSKHTLKFYDSTWSFSGLKPTKYIKDLI